MTHYGKVHRLLRDHGQEYESLPSSRRELQYRVDLYFAKHIEIDERTFQCLELVPAEGAHRLPVLWRNALVFYPALAAAIERALPSPDSYLRLARYLTDHPTTPFGEQHFGKKYVRRTLQACFRQHGTPAGRKGHWDTVRREGRLTALDFFLGPFEPPIASFNGNPLLRFAIQEWQEEISSSVEYNARASEFARRLRRLFWDLRQLDPSMGDQQLVILPNEKRFAIRPAGTWTYSRVKAESQNAEAGVVRASVVQESSPFSPCSLAEIEALINSEPDERDVQVFFEQHPEYLRALGPYARIHPQVVLELESGSRGIPDFFLESFDTGFGDICDLKKPTELLVKYRSGRPQFRDAVMTAVRQLVDYRDFFDDTANRRRFAQRYPGLSAFRPRVILIIGRREHYYDERQRILLESELPGWLSLRTYDDIIASVRRWHELLGPNLALHPTGAETDRAGG